MTESPISYVLPAHKASSAVGYIVVSRVWHFAICDYYVAILVIASMWSSASLLCICRRHNSNATAGIYCKGFLCALKSNLVHLCLKFFLFVVVKIFQLLNVFYSGVDDSFIHCLKAKKKLTWIMLS